MSDKKAALLLLFTVALAVMMPLSGELHVPAFARILTQAGLIGVQALFVVKLLRHKMAERAGS